MGNYASPGYRKVLHTKSSYAGDINPSIPDTGSDNELLRKANILEAKELSAYSKLVPGCKSLEQFLQALRDLFDKNDIKTFQFFENVNIKAALTRKFGTTTKARQDVEIEIKHPKDAIDIGKMLKDMVNVNVTITDSGSKIFLGTDAAVVKEGLNRLFGTRLDPQGKSKTRTNWMLENREDRLEYLTSRLLTDNPDVIVTSVTGSIKDSSHSVQMLTPGSIFSYDAKDLREALKDPELKQELLEVRDWIKTFIKSESGYSQASPEMKEAIEAVWRRNIESNFENLALFEKGGILNSLAGAFGEFQAALLIEYVNRKVRGSVFAEALISDTLKSGEQAKADVTILKDVGIQVKNYNAHSKYSELNTNIHPEKFVQYFPQIDETNFLDFLANYFFNQSFQDSRGAMFNSLINDLQDCFAEVSNLAVSDTVDDTVTFYYIEGKYFVPGSHILRAYYNKSYTGQIPVTITGPGTVSDDDSFGKSIKDGTSKSLMAKYWRRTNGDQWSPKGLNRTLYGNLVSSSISIRSGFDYKKLPALKTYALY